MQASDQVYFELDLTNPYTIASLTSCQLLPRGLNLSQVLPPNIYMRLLSPFAAPLTHFAESTFKQSVVYPGIPKHGFIEGKDGRNVGTI